MEVKRIGLIAFISILSLEKQLMERWGNEVFAESPLPKGCIIHNNEELICVNQTRFPQVVKELANRITILIFDNSTIASLDDITLANFTELRKLVMSGTGLTTLSKKAFNNTRNLSYIDLSNNNLTTVRYEVVARLQQAQINMQGNPLECSCEMLWIPWKVKAKVEILGDPKCNKTVRLMHLAISGCTIPNTTIANQSACSDIYPGEEVVLSCSSIGYPQPMVRWMTYNLQSNFTTTGEGTPNATIVIRNISAADSHNISCIGMNDVFFSEASISISLNMPPKVNELKFVDGCLKYSITGTPEIIFEWFKDGIPNENTWIDRNCKQAGNCKPSQIDGCIEVPHQPGIFRLRVSNQFGLVEETCTTDPNTVTNCNESRSITYPIPPRAPSSADVSRGTKAPSSTTDPKNDVQADRIMPTTIIAAVFATVSSVVVTTIITLCIRRRNKKNGSATYGHMADAETLPLHDLTENKGYQPVAGSSTKVAKHILIEQITLIKVLGEGAFGKVCLGSYTEITDNGDEESIMVAIKTLKAKVTQQARQDFENEANLMSDISHENIVTFYGVCKNGQNFMMLFEYMEKGDLNNFLRKAGPDSKMLGYSSNSQTALSTYHLLHIAKQISAGVNYLSSRHIIHRDLATRNCLVGKKLIVKIGDFGMSKDVYSSDYYKIGGHTLLPIRWMPPESVLYHKFTTESDIWSFGVVLWEIFSFGRQPWFELSNSEVIECVKEGTMLKKPDGCNDQIYSLMTECWKYQPSQRITMANAYTLISDMMTNTD